MKKYITSVIFLCMIFLSQAFDYKPLATVLQKYDVGFVSTSAHISFVEDHEGNKYVVKQYRYDRWSAKLATLICELVALEIGNAIGVPLNRACLIPAGVSFIGKEKEVPATLHMHAPGIRFDVYQDEKYQGLYIQLNTDEHMPVGLSRELIYHMSRHNDLPAIVALDTFVGNCDRTPSNYYYDKETDSFCGIDLGSAFCKDVSFFAIQSIQNLLYDEYVRFSVDELEGIKKYTEVLHQLVMHYSPEVLCTKIEEYAQRAGFLDDTFFNKNVQLSCIKYLVWCEQTIMDSYTNSCLLLEELINLLAKHQILLSINY